MMKSAVLDQEAGTREETIVSLVAAMKNSSKLSCGAEHHEAMIQPELCGRILAHLNFANIRKFSMATVAEYAEEMASGRWARCYEPLIFDRDWSCTNGQHRLFSAFKSNIPLSCMVVTNASDQTRKSIDAGRKRTITMTHNVPTKEASVLAMVARVEGKRRPTRGAILHEYDRLKSTLSAYSSLFASRKVLSEAHIAGVFVFAEKHLPERAGELRELAEDLTIGAQESQAADQIAKQVVGRKKGGTQLDETGRLREMRMFLRAIQAHLLGVALPVLAEHDGVIDWFTDGGA